MSRFSPRRATCFLLALPKESKQRKVVVRCLLGWFCCAPGTSRVSPRRASYFFLRRQKKVTKKKASHVRAASRFLALLAAFGALANSLRSDNASALIRTLLRCSARPNGGGIPLGSSASRTSPEWLVRFANFARMGASFLYAHFSQGHGTPCHYARMAHSCAHFSSWATTRVSSFLTHHFSQGHLTPCPYTSFLTPHPSLLTPHPHIPHPYTLTPHSLTHSSFPFLTPHPSFLIPHSSFLIPHSSLLTPHSSLLTPHSSLLTPHSSLLTRNPKIPPCPLPPAPTPNPFPVPANS